MFVLGLVVHCLVSILVLKSIDGEERAGYFVFLVFCYCSVPLSHGSLGCSAVCDCGVS